MSRPTIADIARAAGVSKATVSRVLNNNYQYIRADTRQRVEQAIRESGFRPNRIARSLTLKRTLTAGVLISDIRNPFYPEVIQGVEDAALAAGYNVFLCNTNYDIERGTTFVRLLIDKGVDGALIMSSSTSDAWLDELLQNDIPVVILDWEKARQKNLSLIGVDFQSGVAQAAQHLVALGHRRFGHVSGPLGLQTGRARRDAFVHALRDLGVPETHIRVVEGTMHIESGRAAARVLFSQPQPPTAIFTANDLMALGVLAEARAQNLSIPHDVSLVGLDDIWIASQITPPLTTVALPRYEIGQLAMQSLLERLAAPQSEEERQPVQVKTQLVVRESTGPAPAAE